MQARGRNVPPWNASRARALGRAMTNSIKQPPMFGFLCAGCGRCLEELPAWQLGAERFYCGIFCREVDERLLEQPSPPRRKTAA